MPMSLSTRPSPSLLPAPLVGAAVLVASLRGGGVAGRSGDAEGCAVCRSEDPVAAPASGAGVSGAAESLMAAGWRVSKLPGEAVVGAVVLACIWGATEVSGAVVFACACGATVDGTDVGWGVSGAAESLMAAGWCVSKLPGEAVVGAVVLACIWGAAVSGAAVSAVRPRTS